jgi:hypothetical protein
MRHGFVRNLRTGRSRGERGPGLCENRSMPPALRWTLAATGVAVLLAGCGGGTSRYTFAKTKACLQQHDLKVGPPSPSDFVARSASDALRVVFPRNEVTVSIAQDEKEANGIVAGYHHFAGKNIGLADVLRPQKNAVLLWKAHPSDQEQADVTGCLK